MIGYVSGKILHIGQGICLVDTQGLGYEVHIHEQTEYVLRGQSEVSLYIHHVVREDLEALYGFMQIRERDLFRIFLLAPGVGPKLALTMLASLPEATLLAAIADKDVSLLKKVKGVGQRVAEKMVVELAPRLKDWCSRYAAPMDLPQANKAELQIRQDVLSALASLGYTHGDIANKVQALQEDGMTTDQLLRRVLQSLSKTTA